MAAVEEVGDLGAGSDLQRARKRDNSRVLFQAVVKLLRELMLISNSCRQHLSFQLASRFITVGFYSGSSCADNPGVTAEHQQRDRNGFSLYTG